MPKTSRAIPRVNVRSNHAADCDHKAECAYVRCSCPKQLRWMKDGKEYRQSAWTRDYQEAEQY
jgi:hypothetical protein